MSYRFRLEPIVKLREQTRDERRRELAQAYEAERILRQQEAEMQAEIDATQDRTRAAAGQGSVSVEDLLNSRRYQLLLRSQMAAVQGQIAHVLEEIERRRGALMEADREVKVLEKLRERQREQYEQAELHREAKQLDEAALRGFARRQEAAP
jgi:flagellar FliJ protein